MRLVRTSSVTAGVPLGRFFLLALLRPQGVIRPRRWFPLAVVLRHRPVVRHLEQSIQSVPQRNDRRPQWPNRRDRRLHHRLEQSRFQRPHRAREGQ